MLVLTRLNLQSIWVDDVEFTILRIDGNKVRVGITAPKEALIERNEVRQDRLIRESLPGGPKPEASR